jgi:hypothetical protein
VSYFTCSSHGKLRSSVQHVAFPGTEECCSQNGKVMGCTQTSSTSFKFSKCFKTTHNTAKRKKIGTHYFDTKVMIVTDATGDCKMFYQSLFFIVQLS